MRDWEQTDADAGSGEFLRQNEIRGSRISPAIRSVPGPEIDGVAIGSKRGGRGKGGCGS